MDAPLCPTCPWWTRLPERVEYRWSPEDAEQVEIRTPHDKGECRRYPPRPPRDFPHTGEDDWCGEHPGRVPGAAGS
jgi:hypothetical protein